MALSPDGAVQFATDDVELLWTLAADILLPRHIVPVAEASPRTDEGILSLSP
jgi:hypothetical protein